jgi:hypothetical protein
VADVWDGGNIDINIQPNMEDTKMGAAYTYDDFMANIPNASAFNKGSNNGGSSWRNDSGHRHNTAGSNSGGVFSLRNAILGVLLGAGFGIWLGCTSLVHFVAAAVLGAIGGLIGLGIAIN